MDPRYRLDGLDLASYESVIADKHPETLADAKPIYFAVKSWLERSQWYFSKEKDLRGYAIHVHIAADSHSAMASFLSDALHKCKMLKRAIVVFEELVVCLDKTEHLAMRCNVWSKLGLVYLHMLYYKLEKIDANLKPATVRKINDEFEKLIFYCKNVISNTGSTGELILVHFICGRAYNKMAIWKFCTRNMDFKKASLFHLEEMQRTMHNADEEIQQRFISENVECNEIILSLSLEGIKLE